MTHASLHHEMAELTLKPVAIPWVTASLLMLYSALITCFAGLFLLLLCLFTAFLFDLSFPLPQKILIFPLAGTLLSFPFIAWYLLQLHKKNYANTIFRFYNDRLEFEEGFKTVRKTIIPLGNISALRLYRTGLQYMSGLGTIFLDTGPAGKLYGKQNIFHLLGKASQGKPNRHGGNRIRIYDIENPEQAITSIKQLLDKLN